MWPALLLLGCWAVPGLAAPLPSASARRPGLQVDLKLSAGPEITAALRFRLEPGWHLYWKNPGDSGLAPEVVWELPEGWKAGPLEHPVPVALPSPEGLDYGHSGTFTLLTKLIPPPGSKPAGLLRARVDWLACEEACVQGKAVLTARWGDPASRLTAPELASARAQLPLKRWPGLQTGKPVVRNFADRWLIEVPLLGPDAAQAQAFFPEALPGFTIVHREVRVDGSVLRIPVLPSGPDSKLDILRGVLRVGGQGVVLELPLPGAPAP